MSTIVTPLYDNTPISIIRDGLFEVGLLEEGQDPNGEQIARGMRRINRMVNLWQTQGLKLWLELDLPVALTAGVFLYPLTQQLNGYTAKYTRVKEGYFLYGSPSGEDIQTDSGIGITTDSGEQIQTSTSTSAMSTNTLYPLIPMGRSEWDNVGTRSSPGTVTQYYVDKQPAVLNVNLWQTPSPEFATLGQVHLIVQQQQTNVVQLNDQMVFPEEWFLALMWGLADQSSTGQPRDIVQIAKANAALYFQLLNDWDIEDAPTQFQPDPRLQYGSSGRFM